MDAHLKDSGQAKAIFSAMGGVTVQSITCQALPYESERTEPFYQVSLDVQGMGSLDRALDSYFQEELMEGDNAYHCEQVNQKARGREGGGHVSSVRGGADTRGTTRGGRGERVRRQERELRRFRCR